MVKYEITAKNELNGMVLTVRFPESDLDKKALYTLQDDMPDFLIPFRYLSRDGEIECTYQLGKNLGINLFRLRRQPREYADFWSMVLQPLLECGDWFLKPYSFVMDTEYMYMDKKGSVLKYIYVPTKSDYGTPEELDALMRKISQENSVTDPKIENTVLKALMAGVQPNAFLEIVYAEAKKAETQVETAKTGNMVFMPKEEVVKPIVEKPETHKAEEQNVNAALLPKSGISEIADIAVSIESDNADKKKHKTGLFGSKKKEDKLSKKELKAQKKTGKEKKKGKEILGGAVIDIEAPIQFGKQSPFAIEDSAPSAAIKPEENINQEDPIAVKTPIAQVVNERAFEDESTQLSEEMNMEAGLRYCGNSTDLPLMIAVDIKPGGIFTIGRHDISGKQHTDFEFQQNTKNISRMHASIRKDEDGKYSISDLSSSAGTFVNGQRLSANVQHGLRQGDRISFGSGGADYIWEE